MKAHITEAILDKYQSTISLQNSIKYLRDTKLTGFGARVSIRSVSFIIETKDKCNKTRRHCQLVLEAAVNSQQSMQSSNVQHTLGATWLRSFQSEKARTRSSRKHRALIK